MPDDSALEQVALEQVEPEELAAQD